MGHLGRVMRPSSWLAPFAARLLLSPYHVPAEVPAPTPCRRQRRVTCEALRAKRRRELLPHPIRQVLGRYIRRFVRCASTGG
jgi:hypothetical protein